MTNDEQNLIKKILQIEEELFNEFPKKNKTMMIEGVGMTVCPKEELIIIVTSETLAESHMLSVASMIINSVNGSNCFFWGDCDPVSWEIHVGNDFHDFDEENHSCWLNELRHLMKMFYRKEEMEDPFLIYLTIQMTDSAS